MAKIVFEDNRPAVTNKIPLQKYCKKNGRSDIMSVLQRNNYAWHRQRCFFMAKREKKYYMINEDILPDSILKTAMAKEMLARGEASDILEAVGKLNMARSTYYKYKDGIVSFFNADNFKIINISLLLEHKPGILSGVINFIASISGNILTINQNLPLHGVAYVTLSISIEEMTISAEEFINELGEIKGVRSVEIIGKS